MISVIKRYGQGFDMRILPDINSEVHSQQLPSLCCVARLYPLNCEGLNKQGCHEIENVEFLVDVHYGV
jgi:hypothetical protein